MISRKFVLNAVVAVLITVLFLISGKPVSVPAAPMYLDALLGSQDLVVGFRPRVGAHHIRPIAVVGFPAESFPGTLDFLNRLPVDYRWSNRFIPLDPNTAEVKIDQKTGTLMREGVESIINPDDMHALEAALGLREAHGGKVTAVSMGPPQAMDALREALGIGADECVLLTDRSFAGADTLATSYTLGKCIRKLGKFDLVIAGHQAIDGDTANLRRELKKQGIENLRKKLIQIDSTQSPCVFSSTKIEVLVL